MRILRVQEDMLETEERGVKELPRAIEMAKVFGTLQTIDPEKENAFIKEMDKEAQREVLTSLPSPFDCRFWALYTDENGEKVRQHLKYIRDMEFSTDERGSGIILKHYLHGEFPNFSLFEPRAKHIIMEVHAQSPYQIVFADTEYKGLTSRASVEDSVIILEVLYKFGGIEIQPMEAKDDNSDS